jgi:hypothetical protein
LAIPSLSHGCENWTLKQRVVRRLKTLEIDHRRNEDILEETDVYPVEKNLVQYKQKMVTSCQQDGRYQMSRKT